VAVADVAYPLAILAVTGSPGRAGLFAAVQAIGVLLAGLPAGQLADRWNPRLILIISETSRALVTAVIVIALALDWLSFPLLLTAAMLLGIGQPVTGTTRMLLVRTAVPAEQLTSALTQDEVRISGAALAGPPIAGFLYALRALAHAAPFIFTAASFLLSVVSASVIRIRPDRASVTGTAHRQSGPEAGLLAGVRVLLGDPVLRAATVLITAVNTVGVGLDLVAVVLLRDQSVSSTMIGVALAGGAVGGLAGAPLVRPLHRLRPGVLLLAVCLLQVPVFALIASVDGPWWMGALLVVSMLGVPAIRVLIDVLILRQAPAAQRGRVLGAVTTLFGLGMPVGFAAAGLLLQALSARIAMLILAAALAAGVLACGTKRELWRATWPDR
jgi:MFS family permease